MESRFNALLSHQGPLKHANHAHRQCAPAPVPTGRITMDQYGNIQSWGLGDPPDGWDPNGTEESRQTTEDLTVNLAVVKAKGRHMVEMRTEIAALSPYTSYLSDQLGQLNTEITELLAQMQRLQTELDGRTDR
tara:strand:+ start:232 stop:630 length:399 start_codon:yes stop_codon:yes gene_type:complete